MGDRRVIFVITGLASDKDRAEESEAIVNWAFRQFTEKTLVKSGTRVTAAPVWMGAADSVGLVPAADVRLLVPAQVQEASPPKSSIPAPSAPPSRRASNWPNSSCMSPTCPMPASRWWPKPMFPQAASPKG